MQTRISLGKETPTPIQPQVESFPLLGDLSETPICKILSWVYQEYFTGVLTCDDGWATKVMTFVYGKLVEIESNLISERFSRLLVSQGVLSEDQRMTILKKITAEACSEEEAIVGFGFLASDMIGEARQSHNAQKLMELFTWRNGRYRMTQTSITIRQENRIALPKLIYKGIHKYYDEDRMESLLGNFRNLPLDRNLSRIQTRGMDTEHNDLTQFLRELPPDDARILKIIDGSQTIDRIANILNQDTLRVMRSVYFFLQANILKSVDWTELLEKKLGQIDVDLSMTSFF